MKDVVIIADFCGSLDGTSNNRFLFLAELLSKSNDVEVITSDFYHRTKSHIGYPIEEHDYVITLLHEGAYSRNISLRRFAGHFIWGENVKKYLRARKKPDVIYCAIPTLLAAYEAGRYCEKNGIRFIIDVQDLWPEAFQMVFHVPILSDLLFAPFRLLANGTYKKADVICGVSKTYCLRVMKINSKASNIAPVYLGTDLSRFDRYAFENENLRFKKKANEIWIAYCGTLGSSYDLKCAIDAISILKNRNVKFIVMGNGPREEEFRLYAYNKGIDTVFTGMLPYSEMCGILSLCDININPITHGAAQSIINKHADYAASGHPVLSTQENEEYRELVDEYQMGFNCRNNDANDLAEKLKILIENESLRKEMGRNARRCAEEKFDRAVIYKDLCDAVESRDVG